MKIFMNKEEMMQEVYLLIIAIGIVALIGQLCLKRGVTKVGVIQAGSLRILIQSIIRLLSNPLILTGLFFSVVGVFIWLMILSRVDLTFAFPISGAIFYILVFLVSWLVLKEEVSLFRWMGVIVVLIGIIMITKK